MVNLDLLQARERPPPAQRRGARPGGAVAQLHAELQARGPHGLQEPQRPGPVASCDARAGGLRAQAAARARGALVPEADGGGLDAVVDGGASKYIKLH